MVTGAQRVVSRGSRSEHEPLIGAGGGGTAGAAAAAAAQPGSYALLDACVAATQGRM